MELGVSDGREGREGKEPERPREAKILPWEDKGSPNSPAPALDVDWIDTFVSYSEGIPSPEIFRLWVAISIVGGAMERRCWMKSARGVLYPNMFILLVAPPAVGKTQAISLAMEIVYASRKGIEASAVMKIAPSSVTKASLVDAISDAGKKVSNLPGDCWNITPSSSPQQSLACSFQPTILSSCQF